MSDWRKYERIEYIPTDLAYLAGIIDGEGCIYIGNFSRSKFTEDKHYQTIIAVTNTEPVLIDWLADKFGGLSSTYTRKQLSRNSRKQVYKWTISGERLTHLCELVLPYIVCKKRQVEIMLEMRKTFTGTITKKGHQGTCRLDPAILSLRQSLFDELRSLHCRTYSNKQIE